MKRFLLFAALAALVVVPTAQAKIWFTSVEGKRFTVGAVVRTEIRGCPVPCPLSGAKVALARGALDADRAEAVPPRRLRVGVVDRRGRLVFRVPQVAAGIYHLVAVEGSWVPASGPFRVRTA